MIGVVILHYNNASMGGALGMVLCTAAAYPRSVWKSFQWVTARTRFSPVNPFYHFPYLYFLHP